MLENIKNDFKFAKEIEGEDYGYYGLSDEQIEWLIEQAEKAKRYVEALEYYTEENNGIIARKVLRGEKI